jgi:hypothetical protein
MPVERTLKFVVVGAAPAAVAIPANAVLNVLAERDFAGTALDLRPLGAASADASGHVLLVRGAGAPIGLHVRGGLDLLSARETEVLPLPPVLGRSAWMSHLIAPRGVPLVFVLDLARLDEPHTVDCPWEAHTVEPET